MISKNFKTTHKNCPEMKGISKAIIHNEINSNHYFKHLKGKITRKVESIRSTFIKWTFFSLIVQIHLI